MDLEFQLMYRYFKKISNADQISSRNSKGLTDKSIKPPATSNNRLLLALNYVSNKPRVKLDTLIEVVQKQCLVNIYIVYEIHF